MAAREQFPGSPGGLAGPSQRQAVTMGHRTRMTAQSQLSCALTLGLLGIALSSVAWRTRPMAPAAISARWTAPPPARSGWEAALREARRHWGAALANVRPQL